MPPVDVISPFKVAAVSVILEAVFVVTLGTRGGFNAIVMKPFTVAVPFVTAEAT